MSAQGLWTLICGVHVHLLGLFFCYGDRFGKTGSPDLSWEWGTGANFWCSRLLEKQMQRAGRGENTWLYTKAYNKEKNIKEKRKNPTSSLGQCAAVCVQRRTKWQFCLCAKCWEQNAALWPNVWFIWKELVPATSLRIEAALYLGSHTLKGHCWKIFCPQM